MSTKGPRVAPMGRLQTLTLKPVTDPVEWAALERRFREADVRAITEYIGIPRPSVIHDLCQELTAEARFNLVERLAADLSSEAQRKLIEQLLPSLPATTLRKLEAKIRNRNKAS
jgi:hypothetical protein